MNTVRRVFRLSLVLVTVLGAVSTSLRAQTLLQMPDGEPIISECVFGSTRDARLAATRSTVYFSYANSNGTWSANTAVCSVAVERRIAGLTLKRNESGVLRTFALALDDGSCAEYVLNPVTGALEGSPIWHAAPTALLLQQQLNQGVQMKKILFDSAPMMLLGTLVYTADVKVQPWRIDSAGMSMVAVNDIVFDADGSVLAATTQGVYRRGVSTGTWQRLPGIDTTLSFNTVFSTRSGTKIYAAANNVVFSREGSTGSFVADSIGLQRATIVRFIDDAADNVYAVGVVSDRASTLFRRASHAKTWTRIDATLYATTKSTLRILDLQSEHLLDVATAAGCWSSSDMGDTWKQSNDGIQAEDIYAYHVLPDGSSVVSTAAAIYRKKGSWSKVFPQNGYAGARPLERAVSGGGMLATQLAAASQNPTAQGDIYKSLDHGQTWVIDTVGLSTVPAPNPQLPTLFALDNHGLQHLVMSGSQGTPLRVYTTPWDVDTLGLDLPAGQNGTQLCIGLNFDAANRSYLSGGVFTTYQFILQRSFLYSRQGARTQWSVDTTGLNGAAVTAVCGNAKATYAGSLLTDDGTSYLFKKVNNQWQRIPSPRAAVSDVRVMCIDSNNVLYVGFDPLNGGGQFRQGVYATADDGKTWEYAGGVGFAVRQLCASKDAVYAATNHGVLELGRQPYRPAIAQFSIHDLDLGTIDMGSSKDTTVMISNIGSDTLRVNFLRTNSRNLTAAPNTFSVAPGAVQSIVIHCQPVQGGAFTGRLQCVANSSPDTISIRGFARAADAHITLQSKFIIFGAVDVGTQKDSVIQVRNTGTEDLVIYSITSTNPVFSATPSQLTVPPQASKDLTLHFRPTTTTNVNGVLNFVANTQPDSLRVLGVGMLSSVESKDSENTIGLVVKPNPTTLERALISFDLQRSGKVELYVSNEQGVQQGERFRAQVERGHFELPLNNLAESLPSGIVFIHVQSPDGSAVVKCVIE